MNSSPLNITIHAKKVTIGGGAACAPSSPAEQITAFLERLGQTGREAVALPRPRNRSLMRCPDCGGTGVQYANCSGEVGDHEALECTMCGGTGRVS